MNYLTINNKEFSVENLVLNYEEKELNITLEDTSTEIHNFLFEIMFSEENIEPTVYLQDNKQMVYSLYDCYIKNYNIQSFTIKFQASVIGQKIENIKNYKANKIEINLKHKQYKLPQIEESIDKQINFKIGNMTYDIKLIFNGGRYYKVTLENNKPLELEKFMHKFILFYEFLILNLGFYLDIMEISIYNLDNVCKYSYPFSSKYSGNNNYNSYSCVLGKINQTNIKSIYKKWLEIRKHSHSIYDLYINIFSTNYMIDVALSTIINCMEGYYKSIHKSTMKKNIKTKKGIKSVDKEFKDIMKEYLNSSEGKLIFSSKDRQRTKIYTTLTNHRNYFAHLDKKRKRFYGDTNLYILLKIKLLFRVFILKDINQWIINTNLIKCIQDIENIEWKK